MHWDITGMLASPTTGTAFALATSPKGLKVIIWYKGSYFLRPQNSIDTSSFGLLVNNEKRDVNIIHLFPYTSAFWSTMKANAQCPGNDNPLVNSCPNAKNCLFKICPYGINAS